MEKPSKKETPVNLKMEKKYSTQFMIRERLFEIFLRWTGSTTVHGIPNIFSSKNVVLRFLWVIVFFVTLAFCIYFVVKGFSDYFLYELASKVSFFLLT
jgi:hypothetical protein